MEDAEKICVCVKKLGYHIIHSTPSMFCSKTQRGKGFFFDPLKKRGDAMLLLQRFPDQCLDALNCMVADYPRGTLPPPELFLRTIVDSVINS
jgi:hypothetical protein